MLGDSEQGSEDQHTNRNTDSKEQAQEVLVRNKDYTGNWTPGYILPGYTLEEYLILGHEL